MIKKRLVLPFVVAILFTIPGLCLRMIHAELDPRLTVLVTGSAILGASFLLLWACDAAQKDISQALALAVVALIAVLPEYAVDMYFTWQAGQYPESNYAQYAIANMTGANRLLIGVAWAVIAAIFWIKAGRGVVLEKDRQTEVLFLGMATLYAFLIPVKGSLAWYDGLVFIGLYAWYIRIASRRPCEDFDLEGPAELLGQLTRKKRRIATAILFLFSAGVILASAEPFSESLVATGKQLGINEFLLVQWLAPIASEAPEFTVAIMLALRGHAGIALGSLISAKLNQWTLLVGMIPGVYGISSASLKNPIPMGAFQMNEILLTAAQSLLAVALLAGMRFGMKGALLLFGLFVGQFISPYLIDSFPGILPLSSDAGHVHLLLTSVYLFASGWVLYVHRKRLSGLWEGFRAGSCPESGLLRPAVSKVNKPLPQAGPEPAWPVRRGA